MPNELDSCLPKVPWPELAWFLNMAILFSQKEVFIFVFFSYSKSNHAFISGKNVKIHLNKNTENKLTHEERQHY